MMHSEFDVIVIGGGHAGAEAAHAAARMGARTALVTMQIDAVGRMSCNPAIGGLGKGQIVCEVDALGGLMGRVIDATGIQFRLLNRSKGAAVRAPRAQADQKRYAAQVRRQLESTPHLELIEGIVDEIQTRQVDEREIVTGVRLADGRVFKVSAVIITAGTFMRGLMHCGRCQSQGGRVGEQAAVGLSRCLLDLGFRLERLKTGTPPRAHRDTVDFDALEKQPGDETPTPFSFMTDEISQPQVCCWITHTNERVHELIRDNLHLAPIYSGQIRSRGPRYCPSIEDKVVRFADRKSHQIFLEPEGLDDERIYCNGISTSLPAEVQNEIVRSIVGLERARILQPGYAVEYDCVPTDQIDATLETKKVSGLFLAGQVNGTSGYEEAAGQGIIAGINAVRRWQGRAPVVLGRDQAYIGVMIDDLVTRPLDEPYRMFTSRSEYRMTLRCDNADTRLTPIGRDVGLVPDDRWGRYQSISREMARARSILTHTLTEGVTAFDRLRRPEVLLDDLIRSSTDLVELRALSAGAAERLEIEIKYEGYVRRQFRQIERFRALEDRRIPTGFDFAMIPGLRNEARERLRSVAPRTLGQAGRIPGINPADITVLWVAINQSRRAGSQDR